MKMKFKKAVCIFCVLITLFGMLAMPSAAATTYENDLPTVYLVGSSGRVYDKNGKIVWPVPDSITEILMKNRKELMSAFTVSFLSSDWTAYGLALEEALNKTYSKCALDNNGEAVNGTTIKPSTKPKVKTSKFGLKDYVFNYDPRLDPWETAELLSDYIDAVLAATGKKKVNLLGRCLGASYISAYLCRYGRSKVDTAVYYASAVKGSTMCGELFAGRVNFDSATMNDYASEYMGDDEVSALLAGIINVTYTLNMLGMGTEIAAEAFEQMSAEIFPRLIRITYGNMPSYWAMVGEEYYEEAKKFVFSGYEEEYAGLIKKIDNYHNKVKVPLDSKLKQFRKSGMKVAVIAKYNVAFPPYIESSSVQADGKISLTDISFGAKGAEIGKTFTIDYLNKAKKKGTMKYISDDLMVDASTCLFPDVTWFVRDIHHNISPTIIDRLILRILRSKEQKTVDSYEDYPRYTAYNSETKKLTPVTGTIINGTTGNENSGLFNLINLFSAFFKIIANLFLIINR